MKTLGVTSVLLLTLVLASPSAVDAQVLQPSELCSDQPDAAIATFEDASLEARVRSALSVGAQDDLTCGLVSELTDLTAERAEIASLDGIQNLTSLAELYLNGNSITDIGLLSGLSNLMFLHFNNNSITDLSALSGLTSLTALGLIDNSVTDISALRGLTRLRGLYLENNSITDISALSGLTQLGGLNLANNSISDLRPLSGLTSLTFLRLDYNSITDISALSGLTSLTELWLDRNSITDISALSRLTSLTDLGLRDNSITDISALSRLTSLTRLRLQSNSITDFGALRGLPSMTELLIPLIDLGGDTYHGNAGGLYGDGANTPPSGHLTEGLARANALQALDTSGNPSGGGRIVMVSIGMSNTTQEFCSRSGDEPCNAWTFMGQAAADGEVESTTLRIVNGALGGQVATSWDQSTDSNYDRVAGILTGFGLSEAQVQVAWVKQANPGPTVSLRDAGADAYVLEASLGDIVRALRTRYRNLQMVFFSSRIYAGYATTPLNPEPYAYESAFSVQFAIRAQIDQEAGGGVDSEAGDLAYATTPWLGWGPYLWANGPTASSTGIAWAPGDFAGDGTHPARSGQQKVGTALLDFFKASRFSRCWFTAAATACN
jgi:Leucine-rich repeat (LRR) protein